MQRLIYEPIYSQLHLVSPKSDRRRWTDAQQSGGRAEIGPTPAITMKGGDRGGARRWRQGRATADG
jgi:hypothetical protein